MSEPKIPALNLPGKFTLEVNEFLEGIRQCSRVSDQMAISLDHEDIIFTASNDSDESAKIKYPNSRSFEYMRSVFPMDYILNHFKALNKVDKKTYCMADMGDDYPISIHTLFDGDIRVVFLLAPRIDSE